MNNLVESYRFNSGEDGSNWGTHFLTLLKGHLFIIEAEEALLFFCSQQKTQISESDTFLNTLSACNFVMSLDTSLLDVWTPSVLI